MERKIRARSATWRGRGPAGRDPDLGRVAARGGQARIHVEAGVPDAESALSWVRAARPAARHARDADRASWSTQLALQILNRRHGADRGDAIARALHRRDQRPRHARRQRRHHPARARSPSPASGRPASPRSRPSSAGSSSTASPPAELAREIQQLRTALTAAAAGAATRQSAALAEGLVATVDQDDVFTAPAESLRLLRAGGARHHAGAGQRRRRAPSSPAIRSST